MQICEVFITAMVVVPCHVYSHALDLDTNIRIFLMMFRVFWDISNNLYLQLFINSIMRPVI